MAKYQVLLFYKYASIEDPEKMRDEHRQVCENLGLTGRIIIAKEGINATVEGTVENTEKYIEYLLEDPMFKDVHFKKSPGEGDSFAKLSIKARDEIVALRLGDENFLPSDYTGKEIQAEELHDWFNSDKEFYIIDMRNYYETVVGHFEGSILFDNMENFRDLPDLLPQIEKFKNKTVVTVCTGGIRCEKASGFLVKHGFTDVYKLYGGIVTYMEKYPNQDFKGKLYVFDSRVVVGFNTDDESHEVIGKCELCGVKSENYVDYKRPEQPRHHGIVCVDCIAAGKVELDGFDMNRRLIHQKNRSLYAA